MSCFFFSFSQKNIHFTEFTQCKTFNTPIIFRLEGRVLAFAYVDSHGEDKDLTRKREHDLNSLRVHVTEKRETINYVFFGHRL